MTSEFIFGVVVNSKALTSVVLQAMGRWDAALAAAQAHCPLQARSVHQAAAHHAELLGDRQAAADHYASAGTAPVQVRSARALHLHCTALHCTRIAIASQSHRNRTALHCTRIAIALHSHRNRIAIAVHCTALHYTALALRCTAFCFSVSVSSFAMSFRWWFAH